MPNSTPYFLGIDAGTTSFKAALFDLQGRLLGLDRQEYQLLAPGPSLVELDPEVYWQACCRSVRNVLLKSGVEASQVASLCISSQGETFISLDRAGHPTRNAIVWLDNRAVEEANLISQHFGAQVAYEHSGQPEVAPTWPACKILWMKHHEPEFFARTAHFLLLEDFLLYRLTGQYVTERALQSSSMLVDLVSRNWWVPIFDFIGLTPDQVGRLLHPGEVIAPLSAAGAEALGLTTQTVAVAGSMDQAIGAVGAGNIAPGMATESTGGALGIVITLDQARLDPQRRVPCYFHAIRDCFCLLPWGQTAGMALRWFRDQFFKPEMQVAQETGLDAYDLMTQAASFAPPGSDGLVVLPHLEGAACPEFNPAARAVFYGATLRHTRAHFTRAILESVAYMLKKNLDLVEELGVPVGEVRSIGGGARSDLWLQIKADVLQKAVTAVEVEEASLLGAALLGAVATGHVASLAEGVQRMVRTRRVIQPQPENFTAYQQGYSRYIELYDRLATMFQ